MEIEKSAHLVTDPVIVEYVNRVGQNIVKNSDCKVPFTIKVIDSDEINAMALPGGFFYVNSGLIMAADEEAELAGVMAHETAHVCAHHAAHPQPRDRDMHPEQHTPTLRPQRPGSRCPPSKFEPVKPRLARLENKRKINDGKGGNKPTLRRTTSGNGNNDPNNPNNPNNPA